MPTIPQHIEDAGGPTGERPSRLRRIVRWALSLAHAGVLYLGHRVPLFRRGRRLVEPPAPPDLERDVVDGPSRVLRASAGVGPLYHRRYRIAFTDSHLQPEEVMARIRDDLNCAVPAQMARFESPDPAERGPMPVEVGREYVVHLPGPWNGPVRVVEADDSSFTLVTLEGHVEAGQITFRVLPHERYDWVVFEIESFARCASRLFDLLYHRLPLASEAQLHMWASFCERVVDLAGGVVMTSVEVDTHTYEVDAPTGGDPGERYRTTGSVSPRARRALDQIHDLPLNFDLEGPPPSAETGWQIDDWCQPLPAEPPGEPVAGGAFEVCRQLMADYEFADPAIVRAIYHADQPLEDRDMLLEARFYGLRFLLALRVGGVRDETTEVDGRRVQIWGWNYRTLQGHLETGQMDYEVWKWLDTGAVEFRIHAFSRPAHIANPIVRLGMALFGRTMQRRFARHALSRMAALVDECLAEAARGEDHQPEMLTRVRVRTAEEAGVELRSA
ncbi:DUF1990 family protein [Euzebya sp.]|uniref:DUF1990 family protein n=1 Tax=Euzebya sp. TaxID=1971409 RepID=UPI0035142BDA